MVDAVEHDPFAAFDPVQVGDLGAKPQAAAAPDPAPTFPEPTSPTSLPPVVALARHQEEPDPFAQFDPAPGQGGELRPPLQQTTAGAAGLHEAERGILPTIAGAGAFGPGAAGGAAIGALGGPFAPITVPAGALVGGLLSSTGAAYATGKAQDYAVSKLPESWQEAAGQDEATREAEARQHPDAVMLGGFLPMALLGRPGGFARGTLPENATALQRLMANPVTARIFGGTLMGGMELGQEKAEGNPVDWRHVAAATAFGTIFNKPTRIGEAIESWGGRLGRGVVPEAAPAVDAVTGRDVVASQPEAPQTVGTPHPEPGMLRFFHASRGGDDPASGGPRWVAPTAAYARDFRSDGNPKTVHFFDATPEEVTPHGGWDETNGFPQNFEAPEHLAGRLQPYTFPPTLAEAGDLRVMGPGITEDVFRGDHVQEPQSAMAAQEAARTEAGVIGSTPPGPDLHDVARRLDPETFREYDALQEQRDTFRAHLAEAANPSDGTLQEAAERRDAVQAQLDKIPATGAGSDKAELRRLRAQVRDAQRGVDTLQARRDAYVAGQAVDSPEMAALRQQLQAVDYRMRDLGPQVASAYRMAADHAAAETIPAAPHPADPSVPAAEPGRFGSMAEMLADRGASPTGEQDIASLPPPATPMESAAAERGATASGQVPEPTPAGSVAGPEAQPLPLTAADVGRQRQFIAADVARQLIAAGRPEKEARANGLLAAAYYATRSAKFRGALGTPEELYRRTSPAMVGPDGRRIPGPAPRVGGQSTLDRPRSTLSATEAHPAERPTTAPSPLMPTLEQPTIGREATPSAPAPASASEQRGAAPASRPAATPAGGIEALDPREIGVDAVRFQFKAGGDARGVTERLQGVKTWDPRLAGTALVFRDAEGKNWVADGHQRVGLAQRLAAEGQDGIRVNSFVLDAAEGITDADARTIAAAKNIAEGTGTAIDAAKVIREARETGRELPPLPPRSALVRDGRALANLGPDAFGMAVNEVVPTSQAAMVGRLMTEPLQQAEAMRVLAAVKPENARQAEMVVREIQATGTEEMTRQGGLFGAEHFASSVVLERAKIADEALKQLRRDRATFRVLIAESERIEGAGANALDRDANQDRLTADEKAEDVFSSLATHAGPVSDALSGLAARFKSGDLTRAAAGREFVGALRRHLAETLADGRDARGAGSGAAGEREGQPVAGSDAARELTQTGAAEVDPDQSTFFQPTGNPAEVAQGLLDTVHHAATRDGDPHGLSDIRAAIEAADRGRDTTTLFQRREPTLSILMPPQGGVPASRGYFTKRDAARMARYYERTAAEIEASGGESTKVAERRAMADAFRAALPKFDDLPEEDSAPRDPDAPRGAPFTKAKVLESGKHAVAVATDERHGAMPDLKTYRIYAKPDGTADVTGLAARDLGRPLGQVDLEQHEDGRWEVKMVQVRPSARGRGVAKDLYAAVERDLGTTMRPSGVLLPDGYAMWQRRDADAVKWHSRVENSAGEHFYVSPRWLENTMGAWEHDPVFDASTRVADAALPPEAKTPEAMATMFQNRRGDRANAAITFRPRARPLLRMFDTANASTFIHESGHQYLEEMMSDAAHPAAPDDLRADARTVRDWLGNDGGPLRTGQHERFARGFEQYLREGVAPSPELAGVFTRFRDWLTTIYRSLKGLGPEISPDVRAVFDRLLSTEPQRTVVAPERERGPSLADVHEGDAIATEPHESEGAMDRLQAESVRALAEAYPEHLNEIEAARNRVSAAREAERQVTAGGAGADPVGQDVEGAGGRGGLVGGGGGPDAVAGRGGGGDTAASERQGGGDARAEGEGLRGGERPGDAAGRDGAGSGTDASGRSAFPDKPLAPGAATRFGPDGSRFVDRAGNIRLDTLTTSDDVRQAIRDAAAANDDFIGDRGGRVTDGQVMDLAEAAGLPGAMDIVSKRVKGQAFNAVEVMTLRKALVQSAQGLSDAAKAAREGDPASLLAYAEARDRHRLLQGTVAQATAEAGRALRAFRDIGMPQDAAAADLFAREATGKTLFQLKREADLMATFDTPEKLSKFTADTNRATAGRLLMEMYVNGLISGPITHVTYAIGNTILTGNRMLVELPAAAAVGAIRRAAGGEGGVRFGEVGGQLRGAAQGYFPAVQSMLDAYRTGATTLLPGEEGPAFLPFSGHDFTPSAGLNEHATLFSVMQGLVDGLRAAGGIAKASASDLVTGRRGGPLVGLQRDPAAGYWPNVAVRGVTVLPVGDVVRFPGRNVAAIHSFFRAMNYSIDKAGIAYRTAANEGLTGQERAARVADIHTNPTDAVMEQARATATDLTLMGQGGEFVKRLSALLNWTPNIPGVGEVQPLRFIDPFVKISGNVMGQALMERTPLGPVFSSEIRASLAGANGPAARDLAIGRMVAGTALATTFGLLAKQGLVTGSGPQGKDEQETRHLQSLWKLAGNQAHSVRVGDLWYDVHRLGPLGMLMGVAADLSEIGSYASDGDLGKAGGAVMHAFTQNILDESFVKGPADLIEAVQDPARYGPSYIRNQLAGFVPYSTALAQMARAGDPYSREARSIVDTIKAKIPGLSESLMPKRDVWGNPIPARDALGGPYATAIYVQRANADPVAQAMLDAGIYPAPVERKITGVDLTDQQHDDFARIAGGLLHNRMRAMVNSPDWRLYSRPAQQSAIEEQVKGTRNTAAEMVKMKYPSIPAAAVVAQRKKLTEGR